MFSKNYVESPPRKTSLTTLWYRVVSNSIRQAITHIQLCTEIKREREVLAKLSDAELQDIGVHRADADAECRRSFFDVPEDRMNQA